MQDKYLLQLYVKAMAIIAIISARYRRPHVLILSEDDIWVSAWVGYRFNQFSVEASSAHIWDWRGKVGNRNRLKERLQAEQLRILAIRLVSSL